MTTMMLHRQPLHSGTVRQKKNNRNTPREKIVQDLTNAVGGCSRSDGKRRRPRIVIQLVILSALFRYSYITELRNGIAPLTEFLTESTTIETAFLTQTSVSRSTTTTTVNRKSTIITALSRTTTDDHIASTIDAITQPVASSTPNITSSSSSSSPSSSPRNSIAKIVNGSSSNKNDNRDRSNNSKTNDEVVEEQMHENVNDSQSVHVVDNEHLKQQNSDDGTNGDDDDPRIRYRRMNVTADADKSTSDAANARNATPKHSLWIPSPEWIDACVDDQWPLSLAAGPWNNPQKMIIGDCVKFCSNCDGSISLKTFIGLYVIMHCWNPNSTHVHGVPKYDVIDTIHTIQSRYPGFITPDPSTLVIHLRLGDIVEKAKENVTGILKFGADPGWRVRNFPKALKSVSELLANIYEASSTNNITKVHIVGGSHYPAMYEKSRVYANCIHQAILAAGYGDTRLDIEGRSSEHDFFYVSHAKQLVVSAGGFSNVMGQLAERRGGTIIGRNFSIHW